MKDYKRAAGADEDEVQYPYDEEVQSQNSDSEDGPPDLSIEPWPESELQDTPIEEMPEVYEGNRFDAQREHCEVIRAPQRKQIPVHVERRHLKLPSDKEWASTLRRIFAEGRI